MEGCVRLLVSPPSLLKRTGKIPITSAQSSQQVCLAANNKLISLDSESQLTQTPPTYHFVAISRLFIPLFLDKLFIIAAIKYRLSATKCECMCHFFFNDVHVCTAHTTIVKAVVCLH